MKRGLTKRNIELETQESNRLFFIVIIFNWLVVVAYFLECTSLMFEVTNLYRCHSAGQTVENVQTPFPSNGFFFYLVSPSLLLPVCMLVCFIFITLVSQGNNPLV